MKSKLLLAVALCAMVFTANAQTEKGKSFINGSVGFGSNKSGNEDNENNSLYNFTNDGRSFNISPSFGHFFSDNLAIGIGLGYNNSRNTTDNSSLNNNYNYISSRIEKLETFSIGPFVRYYVDITHEFKFFGQLNTVIGFGNGNTSGNETSYYFTNPNPAAQSIEVDRDYKSKTYSASINPGFAFFPSKRWAIEFSFPLINYNKMKIKEQNLYIQKNENFSFATSSFNPSIGINFHF